MTSQRVYYYARGNDPDSLRDALRDQKIVEAKSRGATDAEAGAIVGVSAARARQIYEGRRQVKAWLKWMETHPEGTAQQYHELLQKWMEAHPDRTAQEYHELVLSGHDPGAQP
jgi:hypothetical protein